MEAALFRREAEVLSEGLGAGLSEVAQTTWSDLKQAGNRLVDRPLDTTLDYLKNHWQDAVAGAVIAAVNPKGMANVMLVAWSMRGLGSATYDAMREAARPDADLAAAKSQLKEAVSHEGTAFLCAMPVAFAGSIVGRAGANAVFGRNMAAYDMLGGRVRPSEVKANLLELSDRLRPPRVKRLITDLDGTTYPFSDYFAPAIRDAVPELARKTGMTQAEVYKSVGEIMEMRRTHDWPWVLEESELARRWKGTPQEFRAQVVEPYHQHLDRYRTQYLRPYEDVLPTMAELKRQGVEIYALSDAPAFIAKARAEGTGVSRYLDGLYALATPEAKLTDVRFLEALEHGRQRVDTLLNSPSDLRVTHLPKAFEKPDRGGIAMIMENPPELRPKEMLFIGDSRVKDGGAAHSMGIPYIRARYGSVIPAEYEAILATLRPDSSASPRAKVYPPMIAEAASYADILKFIEPKADYAGLTASLGRALLVMPRWKSSLGYDLAPGQDERQRAR